MKKIIAASIFALSAALAALAVNVAFAQPDLLWESFEKEKLSWTPIPWDNAHEVGLSRVRDNATEGSRALRMDIKEDVSKSKNKAGIFHEENLDLSKHNLVLDIYVQSSEAASAAVGFETGNGWTYYESTPVKLKKGWNKDIVFVLDKANFECKRSKWNYNANLANRDDIRKVVILIYDTVMFEAETIYIDNIRFRPTRKLVMPFSFWATAFAEEAKGETKEGTKIIAVNASAPEIPKYDKFELTVDLKAAFKNPFDPEEADLSAAFTSPGGETFIVPGFLYSAKFGADNNYVEPVWKIRFTPMREGEWRYTVRLKTPAGEDKTGAASFKCAASPLKGFVRVSKKDPIYFEYDNGEFYYPLGENVCWASLPGYKKYFTEMKKAGDNWSRVWMCNWEVGIEWAKGKDYRGLGEYSLKKAEKLDGIINLAKENGIFFQLVLNHHGQLSTKVNPQWNENPYNIKNGGPCGKPQDFFTNASAKKYFKNRMRYIVARWGYSPNIMAWELWNELTFIDDLNLDTDAAWHKEMASYIKDTDPNKHLITTSYAGTFHDYGFNKKLWELPEIDYTQFHMYTHEIVSANMGAYRLMSQFKKPYFMAEIGTDSSDDVDAKDLDGAYIHAAIWSEYMLACGGNAMPWWWDKYIHPKKLYYHWAALSAFDKGEDRRGKDYKTSTARVLAETEGLNSPVYAIGLLNDIEGAVWVFDPKWTKFEPNHPEPPFIKDALVRINGLAAAKYKIEFWDTWKGQIVETREVKSDADGIDVKLPPFRRDIAFKIKPVEPVIRGNRGGTKAALVSTTPMPIGFTRKEVVAKKAAGPITIDGDLSDWKLPKFGKDQVAYLAKGSAKFYLLYDGENLYFAADVKDDAVIGNQRGVDIWRDDAVEFWLDAKGDADIFNNMPFNPGCYQIDFAPLTKDGGPGVYVYRNINTRPVADAIKAASRISKGTEDSGYVIEAAIPIQAITGLEMKDGKVLGVNFSLSDKDSASGEWKHMIWSGQKEDDATQWGKLKVRN
ncbi:MAG: sugar-binding protein [Candidatus Omnitrophota bacterium]